MLQPALGGDARAAFVCCISPARVFEEHARRTLTFGSAVGRIQNTVSVRTVHLGRSELLLLEQNDEIARLRVQVQSLQQLVRESGSEGGDVAMYDSKGSRTD